jgi:hypothetical protein
MIGKNRQRVDNGPYIEGAASAAKNGQPDPE